jgi:hypothetical protein
MISLYNETKSEWALEKIKGSSVRFIKTKERREPLSDRVSRRIVSIITYSQLFQDIEKMNEKLAGLKLTKQPVLLSEKSTSIVFNNKEFKPIINERVHNSKNILLSSLFLGGKKVINVRNVNTFFLEFFMISAEFSFIASFNKPDAVLYVDLLDKKTNKVTEYKFSQKDGRIVVETRDRDARINEDNNHVIRVFRPARPTSTILVHEKDRNEFEKLTHLSGYNVVEYTNLSETMKALAAQNYKAVTLYSKSILNQETEEEQERYAIVTSQLTQAFQVVYKLHKCGRIHKIKY